MQEADAPGSVSREPLDTSANDAEEQVAALAALTAKIEAVAANIHVERRSTEKLIAMEVDIG